ncbi:hypothetical protein GS597_08890 [Synechococcales cyanobacterium C]|uniref:Type II secretion system protein GspC N-terminal domain-containing protein n=1 Tax=Petrachloros mirabilis ULC683 TaxID=2781853 RepID=A0A8K1ZZC7_9CYAN|nr:hypothetical protein [Petrachloros mirabilis]NCJ06617.1 hypothetical protein [Petrachloros mirabilis ULC683]
MDSQPKLDSSLKQSGTSLLEANAARLMDELFQELEQNLEQPQKALPPHGALAVAQPPLPKSPERPTDELFVPYAHLESTVDPRTQIPQAPYFLPESEPESPARLVWFGLGCLCMMAAAGLWVGTQLSLRQQAQANLPMEAASTEAPVINPENARFAAYVQRSLERIDQAGQVASSGADTPGAAPLPGVPKVDIANTASGQVPPGVERVYVPLYQPPSPQVSPQASPQSTSAPPSSTAPNSPQANTHPNPAQVNVAKVTPLTTPGASQQTLIGVVEMGEQSVALVSNNGATRRVSPGEVLDESGLVLVRIEGDKAMVQRNGSVHALAVGQNF